MKYYIADLHNGDENIILYSHRPFKSAEHQHAEIVRRWNEKVSDEDEVFLLGDIGNPNILNELRGNITIVCGNHDDYNELVAFVCGNDIEDRVYVSKYPVFIEPVLLSHKPVTFLPPEFPYLNIHGHIHDAFYGKLGTWNDGRRHFNVSAEVVDYAPISEQEIIEQLKYL